MFGAGGVGGYLAARLAEAGEQVALIARGEHLRAIRRQGLRLRSIAGDVAIDRIEATDDPGELGAAEIVVVATKTWQLEEAAAAMPPLVGPGSTVLPVLNGVEAADVLAERLGRDRVVGGLCGMISFVAGPGEIHHVGAEPWVTLGELDGTVTERVEAIAGALGRCRGLRVEIAQDIHVALWEKFMFITATGGVGAVTRSPMGVFRAVPESRVMLEDAMREVVAVARARGITVDPETVGRRMSFIDGLEPHGTASMQRDIMEGKRSELEAWNGAVVRLGMEAGVDTPVHRAIYASLLPQERRAQGALAFPEPP
jgi:2-dehydropantoate 2-reductase